MKLLRKLNAPVVDQSLSRAEGVSQVRLFFLSWLLFPHTSSRRHSGIERSQKSSWSQQPIGEWWKEKENEKRNDGTEEEEERERERERFHSTRENLGQKAIATNTSAHPLYAPPVD